MDKIVGRLSLEVLDAGLVVARRAVPNTVLQSGARLVADLFSGLAATPVNGLGIGIDGSVNAEPFDRLALDTTDVPAPTVVSIPAANITVQMVPSERRVRVSIKGVMPGVELPPVAEGAEPAPAVDIAEAALGVLAPDALSLAQIYNRVTFDPVPKRPEHELALYWDVFFPYGH